MPQSLMSRLAITAVVLLSTLARDARAEVSRFGLDQLTGDQQRATAKLRYQHPGAKRQDVHFFVYPKRPTREQILADAQRLAVKPGSRSSRPTSYLGTRDMRCASGTCQFTFNPAKRGIGQKLYFGAYWTGFKHAWGYKGRKRGPVSGKLEQIRIRR